MKLAIVVSTHAAQFSAVAFKGDFARALEGVARLGYDGAELAVRDPALLDVAAIKQLLDGYGLAVPAIGTGQAWGEEGLSLTDAEAAVRRRARARLQAQADLAAIFGARLIIGLIRGKLQGDMAEQQRAWAVAGLRQVAAYAAQRGVELVLEPINRYETNFLNTVAETLAFLDEVAAPNVGLLFDTFHANIEEPSLAGSLRAAGQHLKHVHTADSNRWAPGSGHLDFAAVVATLRQSGYDGWLSAEILPLPGSAEQAAAQAIAHLRPLVRPTPPTR
jgi:sugar phosphate isomerase/epimerase